jgi:hypothetical protein
VASLEAVVSFKDGVLSKQHEELHQTIGACEQALRHLTDIRRTPGSFTDVDHVATPQKTSADDLCDRLNTLDLRARENAQIAFEVDTLAMRRYIASFGRIVNDERAHTYESLPMDVEDYDDGRDQQQHKSFSTGSLTLNCLRVRPQLATDDHSRLFKEAIAGSTPTTDHVGKWLCQIKSTVETEPAIFEDFEILRCRSNSNTQSDQSIEIVNPTKCANSSPFERYFHTIANSPTNRWLYPPDERYTVSQQIDHAMQGIDDVSIFDDGSSKCKRRKRIDRESSSANYEFLTVMRRIQHSANDQWLSEALKLSPSDNDSEWMTMRIDDANGVANMRRPSSAVHRHGDDEPATNDCSAMIYTFKDQEPEDEYGIITCDDCTTTDG